MVNNIQGQKGQVKICRESAKHSSSSRFLGLMNEWIKQKGWTNEPYRSILVFRLMLQTRLECFTFESETHSQHDVKATQKSLKVKKQNNRQWPNQSPGLNPKTPTSAPQLPDGRQKGPLTGSEWGELQQRADKASPGMKLIWWCPWTPDDTDICCRRQCCLTAASAYASDATIQPLSWLKNRKQCWLRAACGV